MPALTKLVGKVSAGGTAACGRVPVIGYLVGRSFEQPQSAARCWTRWCRRSSAV